jgi:hypothetical protein
MALTLNNFSGFETQGNDELSVVVGTLSYSTSVKRSGGASLVLDSGERADIGFIVTDAGVGHIFRWAVYFSGTVTPTNATVFCRTNSANPRLRLKTNSDLEVLNGAGSVLHTQTAPFSANTWYVVDLYIGSYSATTGSAEVFIDGSSIYSGTNIDTGVGVPTTLRCDNTPTTGSSGLTIHFDDCAIQSGATASTDRLATGFAVKGYKSNVASGTDNGSALDTGQWSNTGEIPFSDTNLATYSTNGRNGSTDTDTSTPNTGPSGDSDITGATIKGAKWVMRAARTSGSDSTPFLRYGDTAGTTDSSGSLLTTTAAVYEFLSESTNVPSTSEYFRMGMGKNTGGRNVTLYDAMGMLAYVPAVGGSPYTLVADSGSYTITGAAASLYTGRKLDAASGSYSVTGADTGMYVGRKLSADPGAYSITGADAGLITSRILNAEAGSYTVTGFDATMGRLFTMNAEPGSYAITGADAGFVRSYLLQADAGAYTVTGSDAGLLSARTLSADAGSYTLTGADGSLRRGYLLQTEPGAYVVVGAAGTMQAHRIMEAGPGSYSITGIAAELIYTPIGAYVLVAEPGSYTVGGANAALLSGRILPADAGVYSISGISAELVYTANTARDYIVFARHRGRR